MSRFAKFSEQLSKASTAIAIAGPMLAGFIEQAAYGNKKRTDMTSGERMSPINSRTGYQTARVKGGGNSAQDVTDDPNSKPIAARLKNYKVGGSQGYGISGIKLADSYDPYK